MQYIVIDLEWNQPNGPSLIATDPIRLNGDIIEIGAVRLDEAYHAGDVYRGYVKPEYYTKMNRKVGNLTHIDPKLLQDAPTFGEAWQRFLAWCGDEPCFLVWGTSDMSMLRENLRMRGLPCGLPPCCDLQEVFEAQVTRDGRQWALVDAMKAMNLKQLTAHDAANDAVNTARLCDCLYMDEVEEFFLDRIPPVYDELELANEGNDRAWEFPCPSCGETVHGEADPETWDEGTAECPSCGRLEVYLKSKALPGGKRLVTRRIRAFLEEDPDDEV